MNLVGNFAGHRGGSMTGPAEAGLAPDSRMNDIHPLLTLASPPGAPTLLL